VQPDEIADVVAMTLQAALAPIQADLAGLRIRLDALPAAEKLLSDLRDRLLVLETKSTQPPAAGPSWDDLTKVREALASVETKLLPLGDVRDRVLTLELDTKSVATTSVDLSPVLERLTEAEHRLKATASETASLVTSVTDLTKDVVTVREKVAAVEVRTGIPGPAGKDGANGQNGRDGVDGLGFDDLVAVQHDDRSFTIKAMRGDRVKDIGTLTFPVLIQRGVYVDGKSYVQGDVVTWGGSQWYANEATITKPGDGSKAWTLIVKRGRDGRDGKDAEQVPVVSIARSS
jgi:hypothetical protein